MAPRYQRLWDDLHVADGHDAGFDSESDRCLSGMGQYWEVYTDTGVPPVFTMMCHKMEGDLNWNTHLHNGDPLSGRTFHVPAGRPKAAPLSGHLPFTWRESADDALRFQGYDRVRDWNVLRMLYLWEAYNGWGYYYHGVNSPYLWSFSNNYTSGRYVSDGVWNANSVSQQLGAACMLKWIMAKDPGFVLVPPTYDADVLAADRGTPYDKAANIAMLDGFVFNQPSFDLGYARVMA